MYILDCRWYILCCTEYIHVYVRFYSLTGLLITLKQAQSWLAYLTLLTPVTRLWRYSFSAWIGIWRLDSRAQGKTGGKDTVFCTRSARLCFGATQITRSVKLQRYLHVVNMYVHFLYMYVQCIYMYIYSKYMLTTCVYNVYTCIYIPVLIFCLDACFAACPYRKHQNRGQPDE